MDYKIVIPSKDRVKDFTKMTYEKIIKKYNLPLNDVMVYVPKSNKKEYDEAFPDINIIVAPDGFFNTVKFIHRSLKDKQKFVYMNDDLTKILKLVGGKLVEVKNFKDVINMVFNKMKEEGANIAGFYPTPNPMFMEGRTPITKDLRFIFDALHFQINWKNIPLSIPSKLDFESTIKYWERDGIVLRFNHYSMRTRFAKGRVASVNEGKDTKDFERKYAKYVSKTIQHNNGTTSFLLKKNPE